MYYVKSIDYDWGFIMYIDYSTCECLYVIYCWLILYIFIFMQHIYMQLLLTLIWTANYDDVYLTY